LIRIFDYFTLDKHLRNKKILVTGASRGIGRAIAEYLLMNNARVGLHYHRQVSGVEEIMKNYPELTCSFQSDLAQLDTIPAFVDDVIHVMGQIDVLVNNAGIALSSEITGSDKTWIRDWKKTMDVNLNATGLLCKKIIQHFTKNNINGKIINISSRAAFRGDTEDYLAYAASKAGVVALSRSIARAYGKDGIVAFTVAPGFVITDMAQQFFDQYGRDTVLKQNALNELTNPEDVAPFVGFLASGLADHATGGTFDINAGSYVH
jgi:NAD(P)-dependent dehydrogenase (short-subunit alcohol dehydrogenase family)